MILNCPHCTARYVIPASTIGAEGKNVRCAKCHEDWFQEPDEKYLENLRVIAEAEDRYGYAEEEGEDIASYEEEDEYQEAEEEDDSDEVYETQDEESEPEEEAYDADDEVEEEYEVEEEQIPDAVKPYEDVDVPAYVADTVKQKPNFQARLSGFLGAVMLFAALIGAGFVYKQKITNLWPPAMAIYNLAGFAIPFKGENLVMESLTAIVAQDDSGRDVLVLKGRVLNLTNNAADVPMLRAILRSTNGEDGESWIIDPPVDQLEAGGSFTFTSDYAGIPRGIGSVNLTFIPQVAGVQQASAI